MGKCLLTSYHFMKRRSFLVQNMHISQQNNYSVLNEYFNRFFPEESI